MFCSQLKLRSLQVLQTKPIYLYKRKQFLSAVRWIDMLSSLVSPLVTIHLDITQSL